METRENLEEAQWKQGTPACLRDLKTFFRCLLKEHWDVFDRLSVGLGKEVQIVEQLLGEMQKALKCMAWLRGVFISYAHEDEGKLNQLVRLIQSPLFEQHIVLWWDRKPAADREADLLSSAGLRGGANWHQEIKWRLELLDCAVVLTSLNLDRSEYAVNEELKRLLVRRSKEGLVLYPIRLEKCDLERQDVIRATQWFPPEEKWLGDSWKNGGFTGEMEESIKRVVVPDIVRVIDGLGDKNWVQNFLDSWRDEAPVLHP